MQRSSPMSEGNLMEGWVNPLICISADDRFQFGQPVPLTAEKVLEYFSQTDSKALTIEEIKNNYGAIAQNATKLWVVPAEARILLKLVFPLKNAMAYYMVGNFLESIAISGFVAEMTAIFWFQISAINHEGKPISTDKQEMQALKKVERLKQSERTDKLLQYGVIDQNIKNKFDYVSGQRNKYLHRLTMDDTGIDSIAKQVFDSTLDIMMALTGLTIKVPGHASLNPKLLEYLRKKGLFG